MTVLPTLEQLLGDAADRLAGRRSEPVLLDGGPAGADEREPVGEVEVSRDRSRHWRPLALIAVLVLGGATAALAAAGVFQAGAPVGPQPGVTAAADRGFGTPKPGSVTVLPLRVADPGGGVPWGLALFQTTRRVACAAAGRVVTGQLGVLGIDDAFANDGRFHPLLPATSIDAACAPPDADGHVFLTGQGGIVNASGEVAPVAAIDQQPRCDLPGEHNWRARCPQSALRTLYFGFLGPDARSISYTVHAVRHVQNVSGPNGGYLVVLPAPPGSTVGRNANLGGLKPGPTLYATYASGRTCAIGSALEASGGSCTLVGYAQAPTNLPPRAAIATPATVSYHASLSNGPLHVPAVLVTFVARIAITDTQSAYAVSLQRPDTVECKDALARSAASHDGPIPLQQSTDRTIVSGQTVSVAVPLQPLCAGRYVGRLYYSRETSPYNPPGGPLGVPRTSRQPRGVTIATLAVDVP